MALSSVSYIGDGSNKIFSVTFPYLSKSHVKVYVNSVEVTLFTWLSASSISITTAPVLAATVVIQRVTPTSAIVDFVDGSTLTESLLDTATLQSLYVAEETNDTVVNALLLDINDNKYNANSKVIKNVDTPVNGGDATNKTYVDSTLPASVASASASAGAASTSASNAAASAVSASDSAIAAAASAGGLTPVETQTHSATSKATPVDADELPLADSAASFGLKRLTWANLKTTLSTLFALKGAVGSTGITQSTARLLGRTTASTGAIEEITVGTGLTLSAGSLVNSQVQTVVTQLVTDSTDIALASYITPSQSNIGSSFSVNIPTTGVIRLASHSLRLLQDATATAHFVNFGIRIGTTNYWFGAANNNGVSNVSYAIQGTATANAFYETNGGLLVTASLWNPGALTGHNLALDIVNMSIPTGTQTVQFIGAWVTNASTLKGTVKQTRVVLEFIG